MSQIISINTARKSRKRFTRSLEYELIASLAFQQYAGKEGPQFDRLLAIPLSERIPGLLQDYGLKRMHRLIRSMIIEFCLAIKLPQSRKLTETKISALACDFMLTAEEDQLSIEDLIIFFEFARKGRWGNFKGAVSNIGFMQQLEAYRQERYEAYTRIRDAQASEVSLLGPTERISPEPTPIKQLFEQTGRIIPFRKIS